MPHLVFLFSRLLTHLRSLPRVQVTLTDWMLRRLSNGDETHQLLSNAGDKSGPRATTYINPLLPRSGCRQVESAKHITSYIIVNGYDEVGPFTAIFDSSCEEADDRQINATWTAGLPRVLAQYGFDTVGSFIPAALCSLTSPRCSCSDCSPLLFSLSPLPVTAGPNLRARRPRYTQGRHKRGCAGDDH